MLPDASTSKTHDTHASSSVQTGFDLAAFLAVLVTGVVLIFGSHMPPESIAPTATAVFGVYVMWRQGSATRR
ncbi:hypothetical protein [Streptomyces sp. NPDC001410]|uniref:hypothetical protein n=1 Tax=Streptomyces sp. NPDC001410 TaxID=3364574 RepID=UPI003686C106